MQLSGEAKAILKNNFTQTDVSYLTDEKRYNYYFFTTRNMFI